MSYLFHFLIALVVSIAYFSLQADFSIELKKQKTLFILTSCVFISTFAVAYICIKPKTSVTWGNNEIQEFDDGESFDGDSFQHQQPNQLPNQGGYLPHQPGSIPQIPAMSPISPAVQPPLQPIPSIPNLPTM